ncbi:MAG: long-chain fatty acid--CoA ligase [Gemmatimonadetes bacterium]|nr:long-chain fatty acid--CoA ligase [Gemmatimonadota bacterium]
MSDAFASLAHALGTAFQENSGEPWPDDVFDRWARRVFAHQFETNAVYAAYVRKRGVTPSTVAHWSEIPWVPASAFKAVPLVSGDSSQVQRVFRTSGTTGAGRRGEHHVLDLDLYKHSLIPNMRRHLYGEGEAPSRPILALTPAPSRVPESSLSFMLGTALDVLSGGEGGFFVTEDGVIDTVGLSEALLEATAHGTPILLAGTAFAFVHWLEWLQERNAGFDLPPGSVIMETGGFKGRSRVLERPEFYASLSESHGVPVEGIVNEYGMTELLSQFYDGTVYDGRGAATPEVTLEARRHVPPPWVRTRVLDPTTLSALPDGEPGLLCHYDLANAGSVMAVLTEDLGVAFDDGFRVLGRAQGAEPRGCSLAMDDLLSGVPS